MRTFLRCYKLREIERNSLPTNISGSRPRRGSVQSHHETVPANGPELSRMLP